jgi:hypothetical protein
MANRLYNKQVSPKGYKAGGRIKKMGGGMMMQRPMMKKGGVASEAKKKQFKANQAGQKVTNKKAMKIAKTIGKIVIPGGMAVDTGVKLAKRLGKKMGGSLKPVQPNQKGLSKLPTEVRNKMGYMQDGGKVKDKPGKNMVLGETFHPITENAMVNNIVKRFNSRNKKFASVNDLQDRHKEIKEKFFNKGVKPSEIQKLDKEFKSRLVKAKSRANEAIANRPGMKEYRKKQQKAKAIDTGSEN